MEKPTHEYIRINNVKIERVNNIIKMMIKIKNCHINYDYFENRMMLILEKGIQFYIKWRNNQNFKKRA